MKNLCDDLLSNIPVIVRMWEELLERQPWFLRPKDPRDEELAEVVLGLVSAALCEPPTEEAHRRKVQAAAALGWSRRINGLPEHVMFTEFHVLRQALWYYLERKHGLTEGVSQAIFRIDAALSLATNASMWGYHRSEIEALGKWEEGITRIIKSSPFLRAGGRSGVRRADAVPGRGPARREGSRRLTDEPARAGAPHPGAPAREASSERGDGPGSKLSEPTG